MKNKGNLFKNKYIYIVATVTISVILGFMYYTFAETKQELEIAYTSGFSSFTPATILYAVKSGDSHVFQNPDLNDQTESDREIASVQWKQNDYFFVARTFHNYQWKDAVEDNWQLQSVEYQTSCDNLSYFSESAHFVFYRIDSAMKRKLRIVHRMTIMPSEGKIWWSESVRSPVTEKWIPVDLSTTNILATDALQIAESKNGTQTRFVMQNQCIVIITGTHDEWRVTYYSLEDNKVAVTIYIDNETGNLKVIQ